MSEEPTRFELEAWGREEFIDWVHGQSLPPWGGKRHEPLKDDIGLQFPNFAMLKAALVSSICDDIYKDDGDGVNERAWHTDIPEMSMAQIEEEREHLKLRLMINRSPSPWLSERAMRLAEEHSKRTAAARAARGQQRG